jgi:hypothetical protein
MHPVPPVGGGPAVEGVRGRQCRPAAPDAGRSSELVRRYQSELAPSSVRSRGARPGRDAHVGRAITAVPGSHGSSQRCYARCCEDWTEPGTSGSVSRCNGPPLPPPSQLRCFGGSQRRSPTRETRNPRTDRSRTDLACVPTEPPDEGTDDLRPQSWSAAGRSVLQIACSIYATSGVTPYDPGRLPAALPSPSARSRSRPLVRPDDGGASSW